VKELLPILDDLERALAAVGEHQEAAVEEGVRLVHRSLATLLERNGVKEIDADGKFDRMCTRRCSRSRPMQRRAR